MGVAHSYHKPLGNLEIDVVTIYAKFTIGSTGACTLVTSPGSMGVTSVTRNSAGKYTLLLDATYQALLWADVALLDTAASDPTTVGTVARVFSEAVATDAAPTVVVQFYGFTAGAAADPASGATVLVKMELRYSTVYA